MTGPPREAWIRVPIAADPADAGRWATRGDCRRVLLIVHNVTSATRLLDVLPLFHDDFRVQLLATCTGSSPFQAGVRELLADAGLPVLPWEQAVRTPVDLALSASYGGRLDRVQGKLAVLSHGAGYNKRLATPDTGHRTPDTGRPSPEPEPESESEPDTAPVFGLSPEWLLHDGRPVADATVLSHPEQLDRLLAACPEAAPSAVLAGDPCYDRLLAARPRRDRFRRALGVTPGQRLVLLSSTWNPDSLFGDGGADVLPRLLSRLTAGLPADEYRLVAALHPNIWHGHGHGQIRGWLNRARHAGLTLVPPLAGWRQALLAADLVLGDQGSVTFYAAALGTPVLLCAGGADGLGADSPVAEFVRTAPRLRPYEHLLPQLDAALRKPREQHRPPRHPRIAELTSSAPGESAALLRRAFYGLIGIPEPDTTAHLEPLPLPRYEPARRTAPMRVLTRLLGAGSAPGTPPEIEVARWAGAGPENAYTAHDAHTAVDEETPDPGRLALADVVLRHGYADDPRLGPPAAWAAEALVRYPHAALTAFVHGHGRCTARVAGGPLVQLAAGPHSDGQPDLCDPAVYASALHAWLSNGMALEALAAGMTVRTGAEHHRVTVTVTKAVTEPGG